MARPNPLDILNEKILTADDFPSTQLPEVDREVKVVELERAANLLITQFTPSMRGFVEEVADIVLKIPRWQLLCGSVLAQYEGGSLPAPSIDPSWLHETIEHDKRECEECLTLFTPFKPFQKYCSNACGNVARNRMRIVP